MTSTSPVMGHQSKLVFRDTSGGNVYQTQPFESESLSKDIEVIENQGIRGTRSAERYMNVSGIQRYAGGLTIIPNRAQLEAWLPFILGKSQVSTYVEADTNNRLEGYENITGVVPLINTSASRELFFSVVSLGAGAYRVDIFSDSARTARVGYTASFSSVGAKTVLPDGDSGLGGTITASTNYAAADVTIQVTLKLINYLLTEAVKDTLDVEIWRESGGDRIYNGAASKGTFTMASGGVLQLALDLIFRNWATVTAATAENLKAGIPYPFSTCAIVIDGDTYRVKSAEITVDNMVKNDHINNGVELQELPTGGRKVDVKFTLAYSATNHALIAKRMATSHGNILTYAATLTFTAGNGHVLIFSMPYLEIRKAIPTTGGKDGETDLAVECVALASTTRNDEIAISVETPDIDSSSSSSTSESVSTSSSQSVSTSSSTTSESASSESSSSGD